MHVYRWFPLPYKSMLLTHVKHVCQDSQVLSCRAAPQPVSPNACLGLSHPRCKTPWLSLWSIMRLLSADRVLSFSPAFQLLLTKFHITHQFAKSPDGILTCVHFLSIENSPSLSFEKAAYEFQPALQSSSAFQGSITYAHETSSRYSALLNCCSFFMVCSRHLSQFPQVPSIPYP